MRLKKERQEILDEETRSYLEQLNTREAEIQELEKHRQQAVRSRNINLKWVRGTTYQLQLPCICHLPLGLGDQSQRQPWAGMLSQDIMAWAASELCCTREGHGCYQQAGAGTTVSCKGPVVRQPSCLSPQVWSAGKLHKSLRLTFRPPMSCFAALYSLCSAADSDPEAQGSSCLMLWGFAGCSSMLKTKLSSLCCLQAGPGGSDCSTRTATGGGGGAMDEQARTGHQCRSAAQSCGRRHLLLHLRTVPRLLRVAANKTESFTLMLTADLTCLGMPCSGYMPSGRPVSGPTAAAKLAVSVFQQPTHPSQPRS